jgi:hypothetical protein
VGHGLWFVFLLALPAHEVLLERATNGEAS